MRLLLKYAILYSIVTNNYYCTYLYLDSELLLHQNVLRKKKKKIDTIVVTDVNQILVINKFVSKQFELLTNLTCKYRVRDGTYFGPEKSRQPVKHFNTSWLFNQQ